MRSLTTLLNRPFPYYLNDDRKNTIMVVLVSGFLFFFLCSIYIDQLPEKFTKMLLIIAISFMVLFASIILLPRIAPVTFDPVTWTVKKYILFNLWQLVLIGTICCLLFYHMDFYPGCDLAGIIIHFFPRLFMYGIIPVILITLFINNKLLHDNLSDAIRANQELKKISELKREPSSASSNELTIFSDTSETLTLKLPDLLYVEANDNYSTFFWMNGHGLEKKMLRVNLKNVESQLNNSFTLRCHRSFIVNINKIGHVSGNTNGYKLNIRDTELSVPVSRAKGKEIIEKIEQLRNMMELN